MAFQNAQNMGYKVGQKFEITGENARLGGHRFSKGTIVTLLRDDGSSCPAFQNEKGTVKYIELDKVKPVLSAGPKGTNRLWTEAPEGATHYSHYRDHGSRWHKLFDDGVYGFWTGTSFQRYASPVHAHVDHLEEIPGAVPVNIAELREKLEQVEHQLTRTGAKQGRQHKQLEATKARFADLKVKQTQLKAQIAKSEKAEQEAKDKAAAAEQAQKAEQAKKAGELADTIVQVFEAAKEPMNWKKGMKVKALRDSLDITKDKEYTLTYDYSNEEYVNFKDNVGDNRSRNADAFELVLDPDTIIKLAEVLSE